MIRLPKYGRNVIRYADAAFDSAWREVVSIGVPGIREYLSDSNPECAVPFNVHLKFGGSGLIGATVTRIAPDGGYQLAASHIYPLWEIEYQRRQWHSHVYRAVAYRYAIERYGSSGTQRPLYLLADEEVEAIVMCRSDFGDDFVSEIQSHCRSTVARWELERRAHESNHARIERLAAVKESA